MLNLVRQPIRIRAFCLEPHVIQIYQIAHYLIVEAADHYTLRDVQTAIADELLNHNQTLTLILDIRRSLAEPGQNELVEFGDYLKSVSDQLSGGVYITGDSLRFGLSNVVVSTSSISEKFGRVQLNATAA